MAGGGGGGTFHRTDPAEFARQIREAEQKASSATFKVRVADLLGDLLGQANARDVDLARERLDEAREALEGKLDGSIDQLFGGSVAKHTYVDGLSDVDSLMILNDTELSKKQPHEALDFMVRTLDAAVDAKVTSGRMAVTLEYKDGMQLQLLPAVETGSKKLLIPSSRQRDQWSHVDPVGFQAALTAANQDCGGKLVPTIKLAKAINATLPEPKQLSGYHIESMAVAAFRAYRDDKTTAAMLPVFFERAASLVKRPIKDRSGQSIHVDEYLGPSNSEERRDTSHILLRIAKRIRNADAAESLPQWRSLFALDE